MIFQNVGRGWTHHIIIFSHIYLQLHPYPFLCEEKQIFLNIYKSGTEYRLLCTSCFILVLFVLLISFFSMLRNVFETNVEYVGMNLMVCFMVFNDPFNNISVISWRSVLLVEETRVPGKNTDLSQVTDKLYYIMVYRIS
jgi:hypothetical protein